MWGRELGGHEAGEEAGQFIIFVGFDGGFWGHVPLGKIDAEHVAGDFDGFEGRVGFTAGSDFDFLGGAGFGNRIINLLSAENGLFDGGTFHHDLRKRSMKVESGEGLGITDDELNGLVTFSEVCIGKADEDGKLMFTE